MLLKHTEGIQSLLESEKEPEKEMIYITKWLNLVSSVLKTDHQNVHWSMVKWTNLQVQELESD